MLDGNGSAPVQRWATFTQDPATGRHVGVVLDAEGATDARRRATAADAAVDAVVFLGPLRRGRVAVRCFDGDGEVAFSSPLVVGAGAAWGAVHGSGPVTFASQGEPVAVGVDSGVALSVSLRSAPVRCAVPAAHDLAEALQALGWQDRELDPRVPPGLAWAGAWHLVLATGSPSRLGHLDHDAARLRRLLLARTWESVQLVHRAGPRRVEGRAPAMSAGGVEQPPAGEAAAAVAGYLRELGAVEPGGRVQLRHRAGQVDLGLPDCDPERVTIVGGAVRATASAPSPRAAVETPVLGAS